ncbi:plasmalemma vesicle-associated protein [Sorex araneus]|uniref:plasmalemma vesicle-associated protein n=1 Tax=Sorex araneus TaxID=42254 RepID=UPI002433EB7C|nr:plasmalemma vesicle-associated protein [Sorex araneus]
MGLPADRGSLYARPSRRGCWYYLRYFFLFVSLIQFLVILGLVLFMVYGNVHLSTEAALQATERRAQSLEGRVAGMVAARTNLTKELNLTARAKDSIMQMLLGARRELDRINTSYRQCQAELETYHNYQRIIAAIILSEKQCKEQLQADNHSCNALLLKLNQKTQALEADMTKEKAQCVGDKDSLTQGLRVAQEQVTNCGRVQAQLKQERDLAEGQLQKVQTLCVPLDKDKFETELRALWKDTIVPRTLSSMPTYAMYLTPDLAALRLTCEQLPSVMSNKVDELARSLRAGIERVARENTELQRQKLRVDEALQASQEAREKAEKEAQARESRVRSECAQQTQLMLQEKAALRKERDLLGQELAQRKQEAEQLRMKLAISETSLDTCIKAKSQFIPAPRTVVAPPQPPSIKDINPGLVEEFKKKILESQGLPTSG